MGNQSSINNPNKPQFNTLKHSFFNTLQSTIQARCENNMSNKMNVAISLNKIKFLQESSCIHIQLEPNKSYIHWKEYFYLYLRREVGRNNDWAVDLYEKIKEKDFSNECNWLSQFFYQEYIILSKPQCFNAIKNESIDLSRNELPPQFRFSNNYMGSFLSNAPDPSDPNQTLNEANNIKYYIKQYMDIFHHHLFDKAHPINIIVTFFEEVFIKVINDAFNKNRYEERKANKEKTLMEVIKQLQRFIEEMEVITKLFYTKAINYQYFFEEKDEFNNLLTALVFKTGNIYNEMFSLFEITYEKEIGLFKEKLLLNKNITAEELGIEKQFRLDNSTQALQEELKKFRDKEIMENNNKTNTSNNNEEYEIDIGNENSNEIEIIDIEKKKNDITISTQSNKKKKRRKNNNPDKIPRHQTYQDNAFMNDYEIPSYNKDLIVVSESQKLDQFTRHRKTKVFHPDIEINNNNNHYNDNGNGNDFSKPFHEAIELLNEFDSFKVPFEKIMAIATISAEITASINSSWQDMKAFIDPSLLKIEADQLMNIYLFIIIKAQIPKLLVHLCFAQHFTSAKTKSFSSIGYYFTTFEGCINFIIDMNEKEKESAGSINN